MRKVQSQEGKERREERREKIALFSFKETANCSPVGRFYFQGEKTSIVGLKNNFRIDLALGLPERREQVLPLPVGEGRGEGERHANPPAQKFCSGNPFQE